jgi:hypothetical protein
MTITLDSSGELKRAGNDLFRVFETDVNPAFSANLAIEAAKLDFCRSCDSIEFVKPPMLVIITPKGFYGVDKPTLCWSVSIGCAAPLGGYGYLYDAQSGIKIHGGSSKIRGDAVYMVNYVFKGGPAPTCW